MKVALRDTYIEYVLYMGVTEIYPDWFSEELYENIIQNESRYTFWVPLEERRIDYYEKQLVEDYSVFVKKPNGEIHVTDYDVFTDLYTIFIYDRFTNSGIAAFNDDCIDYVECQGGVLPAGYPAWFYEYFTEAINFPPKDDNGETIYFYDTNKHCIAASRESIEVTVAGEVTVTNHCVFLRNKFGEVKGMNYQDFLKYYDPDPLGGN